MSQDKFTDMDYQYLNLNGQQDLIEGVILRKLNIHKDESGSLVETLKSDWQDVFNKDLPFAMQYLSVTPPGGIRDEDKWHVHQFQEDRFVCIKGRIVTAIYDNRQESKTFGKLNLFLIGPGKEEEMYMLVIPKKTCHGFAVVSPGEGYLLNFPTQLYNKEDEGRVDNTQLDWQKIKKDLAV